MQTKHDLCVESIRLAKILHDQRRSLEMADPRHISIEVRKAREKVVIAAANSICANAGLVIARCKADRAAIENAQAALWENPA